MKIVKIADIDPDPQGTGEASLDYEREMAGEESMYRQNQINDILEPETEYKYAIQIRNSGTSTATNWINISKEDAIKIMGIL